MGPQNYSAVRVVLAEPKSEMGNIINAVLFPRGLREFTVCRDADGLFQALDAHSVDVLLCDIDLPGLDFRDTMQRIRHRELGINPFLHIVAMVGLTGRDQIRRLIGAGVDDLIRKPMTIARMASRFDNLVRPRKPFVVAEEYVGPNRRKALRRGDDYGFVAVPNSLRSKAIDNMPPSQVRRAIDRTWKEVVERQGVFKHDAIKTLTDRIVSYYDSGGSDTVELRRDLGYLVEKTQVIIERHRRADTAHVAEIAACMTGVARRILQWPAAPRQSDVRLMPHLSEATRKSAGSPDEAVETVREISMLIRDYLRMH